MSDHRWAAWAALVVWIVWALFYLGLACILILNGDALPATISCALVVFWCAYGEYERRRYHRRVSDSDH